ncbi:related to glutamate carboxypeptidase II [Cephalotrichum gorgonifer]|uniref:Related to glutamate carboxypeptidase II n=1 Tax=Cephalotrichum gorgonifer TaxID=2041049 RepID=A0AAE8N7J0_9PEZI|nr:related to glutamate carboxypeptidase II [Cephalotrichum gorgonifer]
MPPAPGENTPLISTVRVGNPPRRYHHNVLRRFCTIALTSILTYSFLSFVILLIIDETGHHHGRHGHGFFNDVWTEGRPSKSLSHDELRELLLSAPSAEGAEEWSRYYTAGDHVAGRNYSQALWTQERWEDWGVKSDIATYDIYLNYPEDHGLSLLTRSEEDGVQAWNVEFKASLEEDVLDVDPTTGRLDSIPTFHGYSASGNVTAPFVYVNHGTYQDFEDLVKANISLEGKIAIAKYGQNFRGLKVKRAQELGMVGCLIYSDPGDDGEFTEENGYRAYPEGVARNPSSVQRGSTQFLSIRPGDPTTPGYPSKPGVPRLPVDDSTPQIPSIPISYGDALPILKSLNGHGPKASDLNEWWQRNLGLGYKGVEYNVGPSPDNLVLNLYNKQNYIITPIWNVIGVINGTIPNEVVIVGNHRDAWIIGGAGDPNSGSAVMNEVVRSFGQALAAGWKPIRTIVFASWDAEEYGLVGSTEWVEEYLPWLTDANLAYVNVDVGVSGPNFKAAAAPLLHNVLRKVTELVPSPNQTVPGQTVSDTWNGKISTMGSGSDFTAFQDYAGVPSLDMGFKAGGDSAYHYHSNYDNFYWMSHFGDPGFVYHKAMAQVLNILVAELSNTPVIQFNARVYADELDGYLDKVENAFQSGYLPADFPTEEEAISALRAANTGTGEKGDATAFREQLGGLRASISLMKAAADQVDAEAQWCRDRIEEGIPWWKFWQRIKLGVLFAQINLKYKRVERAFLYEGGLDGRQWFKHVVFAPGLWTGYAGAVFPGLLESIEAKDFANAVRWAGIIDTCIADAVKVLEG